jgi:hypothetical protein
MGEYTCIPACVPSKFFTDDLTNIPHDGPQGMEPICHAPALIKLVRIYHATQQMDKQFHRNNFAAHMIAVPYYQKYDNDTPVIDDSNKEEENEGDDRDDQIN